MKTVANTGGMSVDGVNIVTALVTVNRSSTVMVSL
jgi:hypothetical protein